MFNQKNQQVAAAQKVMLEILQEVHRICVENKITYWLYAGTLLGAVRHGGFIPWDDDCDVAMLREDYERFLKIVPSCLPETMVLQTHEIEPEYPLPFAKIRKKGTLLIETGETGKENYNHGIYVDIFPMDEYNSEKFIDFMRWSYTFRDLKKRYRKGSIKRILVTLFTNVVMCIPVKVLVWVREYYIRHHEMYTSLRNGKYCAVGIECAPPYAFEKNAIYPVKLQKKVFEDGDFYVPNDIDKVLKAQFGDYMVLPPENHRKIHAQKIVLNDDN